MQGNTLTGGGAVTPNPGPTWQAIGTGDFNGDSHSDILFQNTSTGQVSIWEHGGAQRIGGGPVSPDPGPSWRAIGTGDFNHDGLSDILFQNASTGQVSIWEMSGNKLIGGGPVSPDPGPTWHAIRNRRRQFRHPVSKHQRPNLDLGHERDPSDRRRARQSQSWAELEGHRAHLIRRSFSATLQFVAKASAASGTRERRSRQKAAAKTACVTAARPIPLETHLEQFW